jgi:hypothetical protein
VRKVEQLVAEPWWRTRIDEPVHLVEDLFAARVLVTVTDPFFTDAQSVDTERPFVPTPHL